MTKLLLLRHICLITFLLVNGALFGQYNRWQQEVNYVMDIDFNVISNQFSGTQVLTLKNNSPDYLNKAFYHLYFNAFQPNSMMDIRNSTLPDPDKKIEGKISRLNKNQIGYQNILSLTQDGKKVSYHVEGTILEVILAHPIGPNEESTFNMTFDAQVPVQIRRTGRDNAEGVRYSMSQWYPKMCEYDSDGWHANPYVGREFYGIWGNFDVSISIDPRYVVAATGILQNPQEMGHGYGDQETLPGLKTKKKNAKWHFSAENVHDFAWAADPDYVHTKYKTRAGLTIHYFYKNDGSNLDSWEKLPAIMDDVVDYANTHYGNYPYPVYNIVQGGDGGMEYPMLTLVTGNRNLTSLVGVSVHEFMHSWYQGVLGTNESLYAWMDEGFTSYASDHIENELACRGLIDINCTEYPIAASTNSLVKYNLTGLTEPMSIHADHFKTNTAYGIAAYVKGKVFLSQLDYILGNEIFNKGLLDYFDQWKFKHPTAKDIIRTMEKTSGTSLDWFREYFVNTTDLPNYAIDSVYRDNKGEHTIRLLNAGVMPMPIDISITYENGTTSNHTIPLRIMRNQKEREGEIQFKVETDWPWTHPYYWLKVPGDKSNIVHIQIDPSNRLIDTDVSNNVWPRSSGE